MLGVVVIVAAACSSGGGGATATAAAPSGGGGATATAAAPSSGGSATACADAGVTPAAGGLLEKIKKANKLVVSTDPKYPPQSELAPGTELGYKGFDIDVAAEVARRLCVGIGFETPPWEAITAGGWGGRWDISVGSMTITVDRLKAIDFSPPYYYTPAQMAASTHSGITTLDGLAGRTICSGQGTTYDQWLNGKLDYGTGQDLGKPPAGIKATTLPTDRDCANQWKAGRFDFDGWLTSVTTVEGAIAEKLPLVKVGDPVYYEPLAIAADKGGPSTADFMPILKKIVDDMHADGFLSAASQKWFGEDFTKAKS
jgi:polar amino acid transport system substrate-binding protein